MMAKNSKGGGAGRSKGRVGRGHSRALGGGAKGGGSKILVRGGASANEVNDIKRLVDLFNSPTEMMGRVIARRKNPVRLKSVIPIRSLRKRDLGKVRYFANPDGKGMTPVTIKSVRRVGRGYAVTYSNRAGTRTGEDLVDEHEMAFTTR